LAERGFKKLSQFGAIPHLAMLPRSFQAARMREAARREGGVGQLPYQPI
jgi:hypothetical protein